MSILKFTQTHEWAKLEGDYALIGITDHAQKMLGDIVFIELPGPGDKLKKSSQFGTVESTKAASELYAPLTGEVTEINNDLLSHPQWINEDAAGKGWMVKIKIADEKETGGLLDEDAYRKFIEKENH